MPRDKAVEPFQGVDASKLPPLEPWQIKLIEGRLKGLGNRAAYREAKPHVNHNNSTASNMAWRAFMDPDVQVWLQAITLAGMDGAQESFEDHLAYGKALRQEARLTGNYGAAVTAHKSIGEACGHYKLQIEDVTPRPDTAQALANLLGQELADKLLEHQDSAEQDT